MDDEEERLRYANPLNLFGVPPPALRVAQAKSRSAIAIAYYVEVANLAREIMKITNSQDETTGADWEWQIWARNKAMSTINSCDVTDSLCVGICCHQGLDGMRSEIYSWQFALLDAWISSDDILHVCVSNKITPRQCIAMPESIPSQTWLTRTTDNNEWQQKRVRYKSA